MNQQCPMCISGTIGPQGMVKCELCIEAYLDERLARAPSTRADWPDVLGAIRELHERFNANSIVPVAGEVYGKDPDLVDHSIQSIPKTISAKAMKLLQNLIAKSPNFGAKIKIVDSSYPLAYAKNMDELYALIEYLMSLGYLEKFSHAEGYCVKVKAPGYTAIESASILPKLRVFVSSTCYDLKDCRLEVREHLQGLGCLTRLSEVPEDFSVSPTVDSIQNCLLNIDDSDVVFCVIDQRYGPPLADGKHKGISATHAEIRYAIENKKPVYFFIRNEAFSDWTVLSKNPDAKTQWVEKQNKDSRKQWFDFVKEYKTLQLDSNISNWFTTFDSVVDLKQIFTVRVQQINRQRI